MQTRLATSVLAASICLTACSGGNGSSSNVSPPPPPPPVARDAIPRLPAGPHVGTIIGFDQLTSSGPNREAVAQALIADARAAGATVGRAQIDWAELETAPGVYDEPALRDALSAAKVLGPFVFVTLSTLDTDALTVPSDLLEDGRLRDGRTLSSPAILARFRAFLDWLTPILAEEEVWGLSLGNEVDVAISDGFDPPASSLTFFQAGFDRVRAVDPQMAVTVTLTISAPRTLPDFSDSLIADMDVVTFNYYCLDEQLLVTRESRWDADIRDMKREAGNKPIFIQELGCPVGYGDDGAGAPVRPANGLMGTADIQATFFEDMMQRFADDEQLRAATVFQLLDWSPALARSFSDPLRAVGEDLSADRLEEWLATVGLCRWADATCRPAFQVWLDGLEKVRAARPE
ncbi:MAG: hypothetical protein AAGF20_08240 [Pseudomonadota bacterium]